MKSLLIEVLLHWALCIELPKGQSIAASPWELMARIAMTGPSQGYGSGMGFVPGEPHDDAETIGVAVRALPKAHKIGEARAFDMLGDVAALDPDAVHNLAATPFNLAALVIRGAIVGAFEWDLGAPLPSPIVYSGARGGRPLPIVYGERNGRLAPMKANSRGRYEIKRKPRCILQWSPSVREIAEARIEYAAWRDALVMLAGSLSLKEHCALPTAIAAMPWFGDVAAKAPAVLSIVQNGFPVETNPLPLSPSRGTAPSPYRSQAERAKRPVKQVFLAEAQGF